MVAKHCCIFKEYFTLCRCNYHGEKLARLCLVLNFCTLISFPMRHYYVKFLIQAPFARQKNPTSSPSTLTAQREKIAALRVIESIINKTSVLCFLRLSYCADERGKFKNMSLWPPIARCLPHGLVRVGTHKLYRRENLSN